MDLRKGNRILVLLILWSLSDVRASDAAALAASPSEAADAVRLDVLVREALERNPEIQAARRAAEAKLARIPQARAWPDPRLSVGYGGNLFPPFTVMRDDPTSTRQFMVEQEIPFPGKTRLRGQVAAREAYAEALTAEAISRRVVAEVKQAYFDLYFVDESLATLARLGKLLERFERIAQIRYSVGKAAQQDVLKAQLEISRLLERQTLLKQTRRTLEAQLNSLRDRSPETPIGPTATVQPSSLTHSLEELLEAAGADFPLLKRRRAMVEASRAAVDLAQKEVWANFSLGYSYMQRPFRADMYGLTFSTTLPLFRDKKQDKAIVEARANLEFARRTEASETNLSRYRVQQAYFEAQAAQRLVQLYSQGIVPQSSLALESSVASYETGAIDFLNVITNFTALLEYELGYRQQLATHEKALARLEELTGLVLIR